MPQELIQISVRKPAVKVFLILLIIIATGWSYFVVRWYLGNTLAEYFNTPDNLDLARSVVNLSPSDPLVHWRLAQVYNKQLQLDQQALIVAEYEKAVSLSPNDYRYWMALGTAQEQSGDAARGEQALRRAVSLAPAYAYPHWYLGNLLLRSGRYDEAFAELRIAGEANLEFRPVLFSLSWQVFGSDTESLKKAVGEDPAVRSEMALFLAGQKQFEQALHVWNINTPEQKKANRTSGESLAKLLIAELRFHDALTVANDCVSYPAQVGQFLDGGFEHPVARESNAFFSWEVKGASQVQIGLDPTKSHSGNRSLRLNFQVRTRLDNVNASQLVAMVPDKDYEFECYVRTEKLQSGSTPRIEILDATNNSVLATSAQAPDGDHDWERIGLTFKTGPKTQAVIVKIVRQPCGDDAAICPIFGAVWYDDFNFKARN